MIIVANVERTQFQMPHVDVALSILPLFPVDVVPRRNRAAREYPGHTDCFYFRVIIPHADCGFYEHDRLVTLDHML